MNLIKNMAGVGLKVPSFIYAPHRFGVSDLPIFFFYDTKKSEPHCEAQ